MNNNKSFNAEKHLHNVANEYLERQIDCFEEIKDYIMQVEPNKLNSTQIRDRLYQILQKHGFKR